MFVQRVAIGTGVCGYVRNTVDGSVEVLAGGTAEQVSQLEAALRQGPPASRVDSLEEHSVPDDAELPSPFDIRF
jgi:acylphosphatase